MDRNVSDTNHRQFLEDFIGNEDAKYMVPKAGVEPARPFDH